MYIQYELLTLLVKLKGGTTNSRGGCHLTLNKHCKLYGTLLDECTQVLSYTKYAPDNPVVVFAKWLGISFSSSNVKTVLSPGHFWDEHLYKFHCPTHKRNSYYMYWVIQHVHIYTISRVKSSFRVNLFSHSRASVLEFLASWVLVCSSCKTIDCSVWNCSGLDRYFWDNFWIIKIVLCVNHIHFSMQPNLHTQEEWHKYTSYTVPLYCHLCQPLLEQKLLNSVCLLEVSMW